ncbi:hypothetical protein BDP55DRAFT_629748 [Colletotrichum godetiae]|uniref:Azaphilone pigments biosynthesis cluster protein L N-terminal domain-containing protein n=1 Tax=Colletotrichum godetiae TaxID=1209918 RepID=A0AAJ0F0P1_9PEZI|nr:uncharacterized protein BDP55DRAFT_629748 [Colletotrichum godetiae]KAK1688662.1 hypothetical protein BDP55DRAFT_629748 [Colletotrichum godetiae]
MAEAIGLASGVLSFALLASKSSIALYNTVQGIRTQPKRVRDLADELRAAKLQYMGDGIDEFTQLLAGYKSTIEIALADAQLRRSVTTAENLENYQTMIKTTTDDLEARLENIDAKLDAIIEHTGWRRCGYTRATLNPRRKRKHTEMS